MKVLNPQNMGYNPKKWRLWVPMVDSIAHARRFPFFHKQFTSPKSVILSILSRRASGKKPSHWSLYLYLSIHRHGMWHDKAWWGVYGCQPKNRWGFQPPKWMVKIMVPNPMNKWDDLGFPIFLETHIFLQPKWGPLFCLEWSLGPVLRGPDLQK